jgi:nitric-oxide synthase
LGNSSYPKFCSFGKYLDSTLFELGGECIYQLGLGDELCGQEDAFKKWSVNAFKTAQEAFCIDSDISFIESISDDFSWNPQTIRLMLYQTKQPFDLCDNLSKLHGRNVFPCKLIKKKNLQAENSGFVLFLL